MDVYQLLYSSIPVLFITFCSHFLQVVLSSLLSMPGLQTFWSSLPIIRFQSSARPALSDFRGCVCTVFRVYSGVGVVGVQLTKYSLDVMMEYGRHRAPCNWSQDCVKYACTGRQRLSLALALLLPDRTRETVLLEFPSSWNHFPSTVLVMPKDGFSKIPLSRWTTHLPVTCWYTSALFESVPNKFWEISP